MRAAPLRHADLIEQASLQRPSTSKKFALVNGLRGVAALWVVLFHASEGGHINDLKADLPRWFTSFIFDMGHYGVAIFFALSGFVIAHSIRGAEITGTYLGRFALRRSIRLDPPYWASISVVVAMAAISAKVKGEAFVPPSGGQVAAHLAYLQTLLGYPQINWVYWTLAYEVQFYLALVVGVWISQRADVSKLVVLAAPLILAVAIGMGVVPKIPGLFVDLWHCFLVGVVAYWGIKERGALYAFGALVLFSLLVNPEIFTVISLITAAGLLFAGRLGGLQNGLNYRWLQFLGTISYSLYLIHNPITGAVSFVAARFTSSDLVILILALSASIASAWVFWWLLERPSISFAHTIKLTQGSRNGPPQPMSM